MEIDTGVPHIARIQNYWRGGQVNFPADREAAEQAMAAYPGLVHSVRANRAFLARAVRYLVGEAGVGQFLDIGTGIPAAGSVHEVARPLDPGCRVVYADNDPVVQAHARDLLAGGPPGATAFIGADLRRPGALPARAGETLDLRQPVALDGVAPGSYLALTHVASDLEPAAMAEVTRRINDRAARPVTHRDRANPSVLARPDRAGTPPVPVRVLARMARHSLPCERLPDSRGADADRG